jgi:sortase A
MHPEGTIYDRKRSGSHGEKVLLLPWFIRAVYRFIRGIGSGLLAFSVLAFLFSFGPIIKQEIAYGLKRVDLTTAKSESDLEKKKSDTYKDFSLEIAKANKILAVQKEVQSYGVNSYFSLVIPKIEASADIIANVDAADKDAYLEALQKGVAHAKGTYFPGQKGTVFLFSHSTDLPINIARYNAVFFLLRKLEAGDAIIVFFSDKKYIYEVERKVITSPKDTSWLTSSLGEERLVLQTCDPPGTNLRRLIVIAKPVLQD